MNTKFKDGLMCGFGLAVAEVVSKKLIASAKETLAKAKEDPPIRVVFQKTEEENNN